MKEHEIIALREQHPDLFRCACALEDNAQANLKTVQGLGAISHGKTDTERSFLNLATTDKIRKDIEKTKEKISELQKKLRSLEAQLVEEENLVIVRMVKAVKMDSKELTMFLRAYASGLISLSEDKMAADSGADTEDVDDDMEGYAQVGNRTVMFQVPQYAPELGDQCWDQVIQDKLHRKPSIRDKLAAAKNECADRPSLERHHKRSEHEL